ncbi:MAG: hypothetical protein KBG28_21105 [Kofleriaceae bacterium]|nr:hypothetical protein [Kofleriaceae bacterium]MBP9206485.1 hypothetical protein [Kofleriaceae bacterium]
MPSAKLPPELAAPVDEKGYSLLFAKGKRQWLVHLWSNQVVSCDIANAPPLGFVKELTYRFRLPADVRLESKGFYKHGVPSKTQRERAVAEYNKQVRARLAEGFELVGDSRALDQSANTKARAKAKAGELAPSAIKKLAPWDALRYWGTRFVASNDPRVNRIVATCEAASEAAARHAALCKLPSTGDLITITGGVTDRLLREPFLWIPGDLRVKGDLELGVDLFVSGDLTVDGIVRDTREWAHCLVGGNVKAGALFVGSQLYAKGTVTSDLVVVDGTGELVAGKGLTSRLLVEVGYDHKIKARPLRAKHHADFRKDAGRGVSTLEKVLAPALAARFRAELEDQGEDFYFRKKVMLDVCKAKKRVWRS